MPNDKEEHKMPLWKVYHPAGAFTAEDKQSLAKPSPYTLAEKLPVNLILAPGIADRSVSV